MKSKRKYKGKTFDFVCHNCDYEGEGFKRYDEIGKNAVKDLVEGTLFKINLDEYLQGIGMN
jgi:hypothetical protein